MESGGSFTFYDITPSTGKTGKDYPKTGRENPDGE
jgi:hypothetical protein